MKRYVISLALFSLGFCFLVGLFNYVVDPYAIYRLQKAGSDELNRIEQFYHMRITKPWYIAQKKPTSLVVGTSRTARVPPTRAADTSEGSYNLAIPGLTVYEMSRFIEHAQANGPLETLVIGLDFETFIRPDPSSRLGFEEHRLARNSADLTSSGYTLQKLRDATDTLLSLQGFTRSVSALLGTATLRRRYFDDGTWDTVSTAYTGRGGFVYVGKGTVFDLRDEPKGLDKNLQVFAGTLRMAHQQGIETRLFITPEHIFMIDLWLRLGYTDIWNTFHQRIVELNNAVAAEFGAEPFPLYGFNQARGIVDEPIQRARKAGKSYFEDGTHFRKRLGELIIEDVWADEPTLGMRLQTDSVQPYLIAVEQLRIGFEQANKPLTSSLRTTISPTLN